MLPDLTLDEIARRRAKRLPPFIPPLRKFNPDQKQVNNALGALRQIKQNLRAIKP